MKHSMLIKVLVAIILAIFIGMMTTPETTLLGISVVKIFGLMGQLFLNALTLVVLPLVAASIIVGTARMGKENTFGSMGLKTFGAFIIMSLFAALAGCLLFNIIDPAVNPEQVNTLMASLDPNQLSEIAGQSGSDPFDKVSQILLRVIPSNIIAVAAKGQILGIIFFCIVFGFFLSKIEEEAGNVLLNFWKGIFQVMMKITHLIMKALPFGVFGLVAKIVAETGFDAITSQAMFFVAVAFGFAAHVFVVLPLMLYFIGGINPIKHFKLVSPALFTALSTCSTAATLPVTMECLEQKVGVSKRLCGFVLPLGITANMSGTALYATVATLFIAKFYGIDLTIANQAIVILLSVITSLGIAGIPSGCLFAVVASLQVMGVPAEGLALVMALERIVDMLRTVTNVFGNTCSTVLLAHSEGEYLPAVMKPVKVEGMAV